jgi:hypothetical protein
VGTCDAGFLLFCEIILEFLWAIEVLQQPTLHTYTTIHFLNRWRLVLTLAALQFRLAILKLTLAAFQ